MNEIILGMVFRLPIIILFIVLMTRVVSFGQACCSGGTPLSSNLGIKSLDARQLNFQVAYDYNTQRDLIDGTQKLDDDRRDRNTYSFLLRGAYAINSKFSFTGLFSYVTQQEVVRASSGLFEKSASGIGDLVFLMQYQLYNKNDKVLLLAGGVKFPVGATNRIDSEFGILLHPDLQPGTGSYDYLFGINFNYSHLIIRNLNLSFLSTFRLTAPGNRFNGLQRYEFGDELQNLGGFQYSVSLKKLILNPSLLFRYRVTGNDFTDGQAVANTSGHWLHFVPGVDVVISPQMSLGVSGEIPLYRNLEGTQLTTSYRFRVTLDYQIAFKQKIR